MVLLTLEDVNSVNFNYINEYYMLDTSLIGTEEFDNVIYDFSIVSHKINGNTHTYEISIENDLWCGGCYAYGSHNNKNGVSISYNQNGNLLTVVSDSDSIKLFLYLCSFATSFQFEVIDYVLINPDPIVCDLNGVENIHSLFIADINDGDSPIITEYEFSLNLLQVFSVQLFAL